MAKIKGFDCCDSSCDKRWCWSPGNFYSAYKGVRTSSPPTKECLERAYRGCPDPLPKPGDPSPWGKKKDE